MTVNVKEASSGLEEAEGTFAADGPSCGEPTCREATSAWDSMTASAAWVTPRNLSPRVVHLKSH